MTGRQAAQARYYQKNRERLKEAAMRRYSLRYGGLKRAKRRKGCEIVTTLG